MQRVEKRKLIESGVEQAQITAVMGPYTENQQIAPSGMQDNLEQDKKEGALNLNG